VIGAIVTEMSQNRFLKLYFYVTEAQQWGRWY